MEMVVTAGAISRAKLQSNCHHEQTNTQLFTGRIPFLLPNYCMVISCPVFILAAWSGQVLVFVPAI